jgi:hypothetical protein
MAIQLHAPLTASATLQPADVAEFLTALYSVLNLPDKDQVANIVNLNFTIAQGTGIGTLNIRFSK